MANDYTLPGVSICPDISGNTIARDCCPTVLLAPMTGGTSADYEKHRVATTSQAIELFGAGSVAAAMADFYLLNNPFGELFIVGYEEAGAAASGSIEFTGTATETTFVTVYVNNVPVTVDVLTGDTGADIAASVALETFSTVSIAAAGDVATFTAATGGSLGNQMQLQADIDVEGITATLTPFSGGAGLPDVAQFLDVIGDCCCYGFIGLPFSEGVLMDLISANLLNKRWGCECFTGGRYYNSFRGSFSDMTTHLDARKGSDPFASTVMVCEAEPVADYEKLAAFIGAAHLKSCDDPSASWYKLELKGVPNVSADGCGDGCFTTQERTLIASMGMTTTINGGLGNQIIEADVGRGRIDANGEINLFLTYPQSAYQTMRFSTLFEEWSERFEGLNLSFSEIGGRNGVSVLTPNMYRAQFKAFLREHEGTLIENVEASMDLVTFTSNPNDPSNAKVVAYFDPISALRSFSVTLSPRINLQNLA